MQGRLNTTKYLWVGLMASILPDIDLLYFYLVDHRRTLHHEYWIHLPLFWLAILAVIATLNMALKNRNLHLASMIFLANIFLHLILDTFAAGVLWLYPFSDRIFVFIDVPARYPSWVDNFFLHWSFLIEAAIIITALGVLIRERGRIKSP